MHCETVRQEGSSVELLWTGLWNAEDGKAGKAGKAG